LRAADAAYDSAEVVRDRAIAFQAMRLDYHKLVRDGITRIIEAGGGQPQTWVSRCVSASGRAGTIRSCMTRPRHDERAAGAGAVGLP